jgi:hypothetical protein
MHSELGASIRATIGETPAEFVSAVYAEGTSMAVVGASDFTPAKAHCRSRPRWCPLCAGCRIFSL